MGVCIRDDNRNVEASESEFPDRIGIMADSHGNADLIDTAAGLLVAHGCRSLIHLGDICDTNHPRSAAECLRRIERHRIAAIRGNNEQALLHHQSISNTVRTAIRAMPLLRQIGPALLAHSLPFCADMGARCMIEELNADHLRRFFGHFQRRLLIRGHSHQPEIIRSTSSRWSRQKMIPGSAYRLAAGSSTVITCGALVDGLCLFWDQQRETVTPCCIKS